MRIVASEVVEEYMNFELHPQHKIEPLVCSTAEFASQVVLVAHHIVAESSLTDVAMNAQSKLFWSFSIVTSHYEFKKQSMLCHNSSSISRLNESTPSGRVGNRKGTSASTGTCETTLPTIEQGTWCG